MPATQKAAGSNMAGTIKVQIIAKPRPRPAAITVQS
jgi:hypothetical protein